MHCAVVPGQGQVSGGGPVVPGQGQTCLGEVQWFPVTSQEPGAGVWGRWHVTQSEAGVQWSPVRSRRLVEVP